MRASIIFSTVILFAALMGCSDSINNFTQQDSHNIQSSQQKDPGANSSEVVWKKSELTVQAAGQWFAENKAAFTSAPFTTNASYRVEFDVLTDASVSVNGYLPVVQIIKDNSVVYHRTVFVNRPDGKPNHVEYGLNNTRFNDLEIYAALTREESTRTSRKNDDLITLVICNMVVYRMN